MIPNPLQPGFADPGIDVAGPREGVAFVGSFNERKNPGALIRAAAATPGMRVTMQGRGPLEDDLHELVRELGVADRVTFAPFVKPKLHVAAVIDVMRGAELVCLPSFSESFGLVMIEALAAGAPVAGFGPTLREIRDLLGIDVGEPIDDPTPENVAARDRGDPGPRSGTARSSGKRGPQRVLRSAASPSATRGLIRSVR